MKLKRESMRLLAERWEDFSEQDQFLLEKRILEGPPRSLFCDSLEESEYEQHRDWEIFIRLHRIKVAGGKLTDKAVEVLQRIQDRHPMWQAGPDDQDDFSVWFSSSTGLQGDASPLHDIPVDKLLTKAEELGRNLEHWDAWRLYVSMAPGRCFEALRLKANKGHWPEKFWKEFFWESFPIGDGGYFDQSLFRRLIELFQATPGVDLNMWGPLLTHKFTRHASRWTIVNDAEKLSVWDWLWSLAVNYPASEQESFDSDDTVNRAINEPGGELVESLIQFLSDRSRKNGEGIPEDLYPKFNAIIEAEGSQPLLARIALSFHMPRLYAVDPKWVIERIVPLFKWSHLEALSIQRSYHFGAQFGPASFFSIIKPHILAAFEKRNWTGGDRDNLARHLAIAVMSKYPGDEPWNISAAEAKKAMRVSEPRIRHTVAWFLWRQLADAIKENRARFWHETIKPTFQDLWPPDRDCQDGSSSYRLAELVLTAEEAFPDALETVKPYLVPKTEDNRGSILYQLENESDHQLQKFPAECLELTARAVSI